MKKNFNREAITEKLAKVEALAKSRGENPHNFGAVELMKYFGEIDGLQFDDIPSYGDLMPINEWIGHVEDGGFIDYDGHGNLSDGTRKSNVIVQPSDITKKKITIPE